MRIGILQTGHLPDELIPEFGDYPTLYSKLLAGHGFDVRSWAVVDDEFPGSVDDADGWLIGGSKHGVYEDHGWIAPLEEFVRAIRANGRPLVGICFGHQLIAQALGGKVERFNGGWSVGNTTYRYDGEDVALNAWHRDQIIDKPQDAEVIASTNFCPFAGLTYGDQILSVQPHPEFSPELISELIRFRGGSIPEDIKQGALNRIDTPTDNVWMADRIGAFFRNHAKT